MGTIRAQAQQISQSLAADGILLIPGEPKPSLRAAIGKELGPGIYASFHVSGHGLVYVTHEWILDHCAKPLSTPQHEHVEHHEKAAAPAAY